MRKLILHIGSHKTGSSSIQQSLLRNETALNQKNISFFSQAPNGENINDGNTSWWLDCDPKNIVNGYGAKISDSESLARMLAHGDEDRVISAEAFSWIFSVVELGILQKSLAKYFTVIKVVIYIRRQDRLAVSHYNQAINNPYSAAYKFYFSGNVPLPEYKDSHSLYLNYYDKIDKWAQCFGWENIRVEIYDDICKHGVVKSFFSILGIDNVRDEPRMNSANRITKSKTFQLMNELNLDYNLRLRMKYLPDDSGKYLPNKQEAANYLDNFLLSNEALNSKLHLKKGDLLFDDDYSEYPIESDVLWNEETTTKQLKQMLITFNEIFINFSKITISAAEELAVYDEKKSFEIYQFLQRNRPLDKVLSSKIKELKK